MKPTKGQSELDGRIRLAIYRHFVAHGTAPATRDLATQFGISTDEVQETFLRLESERALALTPSTNNLWMVHPFSAVPTAYPVRTRARTYWANCAWDALAIPTLIGDDSETVTACADCGERLELLVRDGRPVATNAVVHFVVPPRRIWENVGYT